MVIGTSDDRIYAVFDKDSDARHMTFTQIAQKYSPLLHNYFRKKFSIICHKN